MNSGPDGYQVINMLRSILELCRSLFIYLSVLKMEQFLVEQSGLISINIVIGELAEF